MRGCCCIGKKLPTDQLRPRHLITLTQALGALTQFLDDGLLPINNNWIMNQIRPIAIGRSNSMFAVSLRADHDFISPANGDVCDLTLFSAKSSLMRVELIPYFLAVSSV